MSVTNQLSARAIYDLDSETPRSLGAPKLHTGLILQFGLCASILPPAFFFHHPEFGELAFFACFFACLAYRAARKQVFPYLSLLVSAMPLLAIFRGTYIPFNTVVASLALSAGWAFINSEECRRVVKKKSLMFLLGITLLYWWLSFMITGFYSANLRSLELSICAAVVFMLAERRSYLSTALIGTAISVAAIGLMLLPYGDRLGMAVVEDTGQNLGNPILLGVPSSLVLLLSISEGGRWLLLERKPVWRVIVGLSCGIFLILSTSRGSWAITAACLAIMLVLDRRARMPMLMLGVALLLTVLALMTSPRMQDVIHYFTKATSADTNLTQKTEGRIEQWEAFPSVYHASPIWGFGPGRGLDIAIQFAGRKLEWHSIYLLIGAETGTIGLTILFILLGVLLKDGFVHLRRYGEIAPLLGTVSFMIMGLSVSALDSLGGLLLGVGFLAGKESNLWLVREL